MLNRKKRWNRGTFLKFSPLKKYVKMSLSGLFNQLRFLAVLLALKLYHAMICAEVSFGNINPPFIHNHLSLSKLPWTRFKHENNISGLGLVRKPNLKFTKLKVYQAESKLKEFSPSLIFWSYDWAFLKLKMKIREIKILFPKNLWAQRKLKFKLKKIGFIRFIFFSN